MVLFQVIDKFSLPFAQSAFKLETVRTDNLIFRLHYKLSVWLVVLYSICYMWVAISNPISCLGSPGGERSMNHFKKEVNDYCWVHGTFVVEDITTGEQVYPGIGRVPSGGGRERYHHYYKWMYFYIFFMIILLHAPRQFWRNVEGGRMRSLAGKLKGLLFVTSEANEREKESLTQYIFCHLGYFRHYAFSFIFAEVLNVAVSGYLLYMWDSITDHEFSQNGIEYTTFERTAQNQRTDRLSRVFPIMGKCIFKKYGPSGGIENHDFLCVLPLNLINEKAAIFFWYYFIMLTAIGLFALLYRIVIIACKPIRMSLLCGLTPLSASENVEVLKEELSYSDWFVIFQLGCNIEPVVFREIIQKLCIKIRQRS